VNSFKKLANKIKARQRLGFLRRLPVYFFICGVRQTRQLLSPSKAHRTIAVKVRGYRHPIHVRIGAGTTDAFVFQQIFIDGEYDAKIPFEPKFILDGGANCGYAAVYFARRFPSAKILSIEPSASNVAMIRKNTARYKTVRILEGGIWDSDQYLRIANKNAEHWAFRVKKTSKARAEMKGFTIGTLMKKYGFPRLDILKLDIEGSEKEVFSKNYRSWLAKTRFMFVEFHDRFNPGATTTVEKAIKPERFNRSHMGENHIFYRASV
jgi:FkbM family methyltransferase